MPNDDPEIGMLGVVPKRDLLKRVGAASGFGPWKDIEPGESPSQLPGPLKSILGMVGFFDPQHDQRIKDLMQLQEVVGEAWRTGIKKRVGQAMEPSGLETQGQALQFPQLFTSGLLQPQMRTTGQLEVQGPPTLPAMLAVPPVSENALPLSAFQDLPPGQVPRMTTPIQEIDPTVRLSPLQQNIGVEFLTQQAQTKGRQAPVTVQTEAERNEIIGAYSELDALRQQEPPAEPEAKQLWQERKEEAQARIDAFLGKDTPVRKRVEARIAGGGAPKAVSDENRIALSNFKAPYLQLPPAQQQQVNDLLTDEFKERNRFRMEQQVNAQVVAAKRIEKEVPKRPSAKQLDDLADQLTTLSQTTNILQTFDPRFIGPAAGRFGNIKEMIGAIGGDEASFRAATARLRNATIKAITGAQMGEREADRIRQELPEFNLKPEAFIARLKLTFLNMHDMAQRYRKILKQGGVDIEALDPIPDIPDALRQDNRDTLRQLGGIQAATMPRIKNDADFDKLPSGTEFIAPDGTRRRKP